MFSIGDFARHGRVSVRMLRHYDAIGLLPPAHAEGQDFAIVDLPEVQAATIVHRGSMDEVMTTIQTLARWIDANGHRSAGYNRELYLSTGPDRDTWVTELQEPLVAAG